MDTITRDTINEFLAAYNTLVIAQNLKDNLLQHPHFTRRNRCTIQKMQV